MDLGGAVKCIEAAQELGVDRFLIVSSMGNPRHSRRRPDEPYLEAKRDADLRIAGLAGCAGRSLRPAG